MDRNIIIQCSQPQIYTPKKQAARSTFFGVFSLQHRGQDGAGIASCDGNHIHSHKGPGLVHNIFTEETIKSLWGHFAIGHTRYSTTGIHSVSNMQPFVVETFFGPIALAHNGQLSRGRSFRNHLMSRGVAMFSTSDSESIIQFIASQPIKSDMKNEEGKNKEPICSDEIQVPNWIGRIKQFINQAEGAYACVMLTKDGLYAWRDPLGLRPLCFGKINEDEVTATHHVSGKEATKSLDAATSTSVKSPKFIHTQQDMHNHDSTSGEKEEARTDESNPSDRDSDKAYNYPLGKQNKHKDQLHGCCSNNLVKTAFGTTCHESGWAFSSESCALHVIRAQIVRDVQPGEIVHIDLQGHINFSSIFDNFNQLLSSSLPPTKMDQVIDDKMSKEVSILSSPLRMIKPRALCIFEYIYFARPDSIIDGRSVHRVRQWLGKLLASTTNIPDADIVVGVPDSSTPIAISYAQEANIPYTEGLVKNRYVARTFIQPDQNIRSANVELKFNPLSANLKDQRVIVIDDSIVRGTTSLQLVQLLRRSGAREVHLRIACPPIKYPCYMGVDMKTGNELIANHYNNLEALAKALQADSIEFLSHQGMLLAAQRAEDNKPVISSINNPFISRFEQGEKDKMEDEKMKRFEQPQLKTIDEAVVLHEGKGCSSQCQEHQFCSACFTGKYPLVFESW